MPIHKYSCQICWNEFQFGKDWGDPDPPCPSCGGTKYWRVYAVSGEFPVTHINLNWTQKDGEGFTSKFVRKEELAEMNKECRER